MFDGTDLSLAYGPPPTSFEPMSPPPQQSTTPPEIQPPPAPPQAPPTQIAQPPDVQYSPPPAMFMQQTPQAPAAYSRPPADDTIWDRISQKKLDVLKLFVLALVILLGVSMDRFATHYLTSYISSSILSDFQELLVRLSYPVIVLIVLWVIKASV